MGRNSLSVRGMSPADHDLLAVPAQPHPLRWWNLAMLGGASGALVGIFSGPVTMLGFMWLENYLHGIPRTYLYELLDEASDPGLKDNQLHWGLIRSNGTEKPAFSALRNLISEVDDSGEPRILMPLAWSLTNPGARVEHLLLQKSDGEFDLILWQEVPSFDTRRQADLENPPVTATLKLADKARTITLFEPARQAAPTRTYAGVAQIPVEIPDHPLVVRILMP